MSLIFVTGGARVVGSPLVDALLEKGYPKTRRALSNPKSCTRSLPWRLVGIISSSEVTAHEQGVAATALGIHSLASTA